MHQSVLFCLHNFTFANSSRNTSSDISISMHFLCNLSVRFHGQSTAGYTNRRLKRPTFLAMVTSLSSSTLRVSQFSLHYWPFISCQPISIALTISLPWLSHPIKKGFVFLCALSQWVVSITLQWFSRVSQLEVSHNH